MASLRSALTVNSDSQSPARVHVQVYPSVNLSCRKKDVDVEGSVSRPRLSQLWLFGLRIIIGVEALCVKVES